MIVYGISANEHDASLAVVDGEEILFAASAERYSRVKNDPNLHAGLLADAAHYGTPDLVAWYERPYLKRARRLWSGQYRASVRCDGARWVGGMLPGVPVRYVGHHRSHAAAGFFTSPFDEAAVLVVDAIGEWETVSAWIGQGSSLSRIWSQRYPNSIGLLYSAFTQRVGLKPNEEEYIMMGMAAHGQPVYRDLIWQDFIQSFDPPRLMLKEDVHRGIRWWRPEIRNEADLAASVQDVIEEIMLALVRWLGRVSRSGNLVLMGGVALNCLANSRIAVDGQFDRIWIMPNPGDGGSSLGAAGVAGGHRLRWKNPYLGHEIDRSFDSQSAVSALLADQVIGVATGRAEFGPRALGNRSLLVDPRNSSAKARLDRIKQREPFRPFAPIVLAEHAAEHFDLPVASSPYMQFVGKVREPGRFPAICHHDNTARVQTLTRDQNPVIYGLLEAFYAASGCPMLLNTSLNIKGEPLVNTWADAVRFANQCGVAVY